MATGGRASDRVDPNWPPRGTDGEQPVSELAADRQGSLSPFGDESFPVPAENLPYVHPVTIINR